MKEVFSNCCGSSVEEWDDESGRCDNCGEPCGIFYKNQQMTYKEYIQLGGTYKKLSFEEMMKISPTPKGTVQIDETWIVREWDNPVSAISPEGLLYSLPHKSTSKILYTTDGDGNPKSSSVFTLNNSDEISTNI